VVKPVNVSYGFSSKFEVELTLAGIVVGATLLSTLVLGLIATHRLVEGNECGADCTHREK
jgi:hypothetical protein